MTNTKIVSDAALDDAYSIMAAIIRDHGEKYLPVFKRLHEEKLQRNARNELKEIALQLAKKRNPDSY